MKIKRRCLQCRKVFETDESQGPYKFHNRKCHDQYFQTHPKSADGRTPAVRLALAKKLRANGRTLAEIGTHLKVSGVRARHILHPTAHPPTVLPGLPRAIHNALIESGLDTRQKIRSAVNSGMIQLATNISTKRIRIIRKCLKRPLS